MSNGALSPLTLSIPEGEDMLTALRLLQGVRYATGMFFFTFLAVIQLLSEIFKSRRVYCLSLRHLLDYGS